MTPQVTFTTTNKRVWKLPTSTQPRATWHTDSLKMVVLSSAGASRYHICCIDVGTCPEYFGYTLVYVIGARGGAVVEALRYKPEGRGIDSRWCHWNFSLTILPAVLWPLGSTQRLTVMSTRIFPGGKVGRCVGLTTLPHSCADCLKIWELQPPGTLRACQGL
jgi:hypothetical protein